MQGLLRPSLPWFQLLRFMENYQIGWALSNKADTSSVLMDAKVNSFVSELGMDLFCLVEK